MTGSLAAEACLRRKTHHEAEVVVVGAGVFGCAIAYALANQGRSVLLLERWIKEPDRIVGELLQPGGVAALRKLGLGDCLEGIDAIPCHGYTVFFQGQECPIPYPPVDHGGHVPHKWGGAGDGSSGKRPEGRSFHHGRFIGRLRKACMAHANITVVETEVVKLVRGQHANHVLGVESRTKHPHGGEKRPDYFFGHLTIVADGYDSHFRKQVLCGSKSKPIVRSKFYALQLIDCDLPRPGLGHVIIGDAYPVLVYQIGAHETRMLIDVPTGIPEASPAAGGVRGYIRDIVLPALPCRIRPSAERALADGKIPRSMPNSWLPSSRQSTPGLILLGDAFNMRHPLTGGGMTVALGDALELSQLVQPLPNLEDSRAVQSVIDTLYWRRKNRTAIINILAQALYSLFAADDRQLRALQAGCFEYFRRGSTDGPCGLLAGIVHQPMVLVYHFFSVAFLAIWINACAVVGSSLLAPLHVPLALIDMVLILWKASIVFLPLLWREVFQ
ncbi:hypothetical protein CDD81_5892 [Ophiocordyceps australis]|uniref:Squalene monooxygenase n=1 Tax=Ophiocordyceps australis TaxID=1399860 RepID=A0A2C5YH03_9HYPO|nr:hypothetical protein CDD81_5892 [Ophiocordyceps australis]